MSSRRRPFTRSAFTLLELLVVVGILSLLVAILLPTLRVARENATRLTCVVKLRNIAQAAQFHAAEHRGYLPLAGTIGTWPFAEQVGDASMKKYMYYQFAPGEFPDQPATASGQVPLPLTGALAHYMSIPVDTSNAPAVRRTSSSEEVERHFACPSDEGFRRGGITFTSMGLVWESRMSYGLNAAVFGALTSDRKDGLMGNVRRIANPSEVFLFVDSRGAGWPEGLQIQRGPTLYDHWRAQGRAPAPGWDPATARLPPDWHRNRVNVAFVDGHCETLMLPLDWERLGIAPDQAGKGDLERAGVWKGISR